MTFAVTVHASIDELPTWNSIAADGGFYCSAEWLRFLDAPGATYVAVRRGDEIVAVAPCFVVDEHHLGDLVDLFGDDEAANAALARELAPILVCGPVRGYSSRLLVRPNLDAPARAEAIAVLIEAVRNVGRRAGTTAIAYNYYPIEHVGEMLAAAPRLHAVFAESECIFGPLTTYEAYMADRDRRQRMRREMRRLESEGMRVDRRSLREVLEPLSEIIAHHEQKFGEVTVAFIRNHYEERIARGLDAISDVLCAWSRDGTLMAAAVFNRFGRTYYARDYGTRPDAPAGADLYFNLLINEPVRIACRDGLDHIHYGQRSLDTKLHRGCFLRPLWFVIDAPWSAERCELLRAKSRARLDAEATIAARFHDASRVRDELALDAANAVLGR